ncbi:glycosyltransferase family 4 protein [Roseimarinus sediminis]|uniref:glycosyltransferase family 4 protein n=1 Tax=Roseimarinus sediminis TaxID=1610899 RepID=UPI003D201419
MKKKVLLVHTAYSTFVKQDYESLSEKYEVSLYPFNASKKLHVLAWSLFKQAFFLLLHGWQYHSFFIWFADYHSLLPVVFARWSRKKSYLVIGGYDVGRIPELKYGAFFKKFRGFFAIQSMKKAGCNLTVSHYVDRKVRFIAPGAKRRMVYNSVKFDGSMLSAETKEQLIITVGLIDGERSFQLKGIDTFIDVAKLLPEYRFMVIGVSEVMMERLADNVPSNVTLCSPVAHQQLVEYYQKASVYLQLSRMDTFCLALAEGMYFNCYPMITRVGGMPEVIGPHGETVARNKQLIAARLKIVLDKELRVETRSYVTANFSNEVRKKKLLALMEA